MKSCNECAYKAGNLGELKRHKRDEHGLITSSTSPPAKKKRNNVENNNESLENMDTDTIASKDIKVEDIEIDECEKIQKELSLKMDKKVEEKRERIDNNENKWIEEKIEKEKIKEQKEKVMEESIKKTKKIYKQRKKDARKRLSRKQKKECKSNVSNIKDVPLNCKKFVNEGDMIYTVLGNGACFQNSAAAHLFQDENLGPKLKIQMNMFFSEHYENYKQIVPCSEEEPFVRQLKGEVKTFKDPEKIKMFLQYSQEAGYVVR